MFSHRKKCAVREGDLGRMSIFLLAIVTLLRSDGGGYQLAP